MSSTRQALLFAMRYVLPAVVIVAGIAFVVLDHDGLSGPAAFSALAGAGGSIFLMNKLMRVSIDGERDRDEDEAARLFLDRYRMWPDEVPEGWVPPDGEPDAETALAHILADRSHSMVAA
jgi:hypothetical protein